MMIWVALVLAVSALLLAGYGLVAGGRQSIELSSWWNAAELERIDGKMQSLENDLRESSSRLAMAVEQLKVSRENLDTALTTTQQHTEQLTDMTKRADAHFIAADADAIEATTLVAELERYAVGSLEQAATDSKPRILRGGLYAQRPVLELVPDLVDSFLTALNAGLMYRQADPPHGSRFYLRWPGNLPSPELLLDTLLKAADGKAQPGEQPGTAELQILLHAVHAGSPAILFIGPLIIERGTTDTSAGLAPPSWPGPTDAQKMAGLAGNDPALINQIGARRVVVWPTELTA
jgi:hypothetical protein